MLREKAESFPYCVAYEFADAQGRCDSLSYRELADRCWETAVQLDNARSGGKRGPALVCYPPGLDYVVAILGCMTAGVPAIPAYPPYLWSRAVGMQRLQHIIRD